MVKLYADLVVGGARTTDPVKSEADGIKMVPANLIEDVIIELEKRGTTIR